MFGRLMLGGLVAGLVLFAWGAFSWMVLPWHMQTLHAFKDEAAVTQAIKANTVESGIYFLPMQEQTTAANSDTTNATPAAAKATDTTVTSSKSAGKKGTSTKGSDKKDTSTTAASTAETNPTATNTTEAKDTAQPQGPLVFASVSQEGMTPMLPSMIRGLIACIIAALLVTWMVMQTNLDYAGRLLFVVVFAFAGSVLTHFTYWNWFHFASDFTLLEIADSLISWFLAGLVIAAVTGRKRNRY